MNATGLTNLAKILGLGIAAAIASPSGYANTLTFTLGAPAFNGAQPTSASPWMIATFQDVSANNVRLTLTSSLETPSEFIDQIGFNVGPSINATTMTIVQNPAVHPLLVDFEAVANNNQNKLKLTGGGSPGFGFDVLLNFTTSSGVDRFDGTDVVTFDLHANGLDATDFNYINTGSALAHVAAHVQGIPSGSGTTSGAIKDVVPVADGGSILMLAGAAFGCLGLVRRRDA